MNIVDLNNAINKLEAEHKDIEESINDLKEKRKRISESQSILKNRLNNLLREVRGNGK